MLRLDRTAHLTASRTETTKIGGRGQGGQTFSG